MLFVGCELIEDYWGNNDNSNENWKFAYAENYVDSLDAIFCRDGYTALFGFRDLESYPNKQTDSRVIYVVKTDMDSGKVDLDDATVVIVDSTYFPIQIANKKTNIILTRVDDNHFSCTSYNYKSNSWEEYKNIEFDLSTYARPDTRALSSDGYSVFNYANALQAISVTSNIGSILHPLNVGDQLSAGIGLLGDASSYVDKIPILNKVLTDETGLAIGVTLASNLAGASVALLGYLTAKVDELVVAALGRVRISIEDICQTTNNACEISYSVNGLNDDGATNSLLYIDVFSYNDSKLIRTTLPSRNGYNIVTLKGLKHGKYGAYLGLYSTKYPIVNYRTNPLVLFGIYNLEVSKYEIEKNPLYKNGAVNFKMRVFLKGSEEGLKDSQQFGYYIKYANVIDYRKVDYLSSIFESTPLTYDLSIPRDGFSDETINYTTFEAKPSIDYFIGVYTENDGKLQTYDEQKLELIYNEQPEIETGEYVPVSPTTVNVEGEFKNCLFWNAIRGIEYVAESESNPKSIVLGANEEDGEHQFPLENLKPNTTYQYRAYYEVNGIREYGEPMEFKTEPLNLTLDSYEIEENPLCSLDGNVSFKMRINILGDNNIFTYARECGYYIRTANRINYYQIEKFSSIFSSTQINHNLIINKDEFNIIDYSSFRAEATEYKIGVYVVEKSNNNILLLCEKDLMGLIYNERPAIIFSNAFVTESKYDGSREIDDITYTFTRFWTSATVHAEGVLFIDLENLIYHEKSGDRDEETRKISLSLGTTSGWGQGSLWIGTRDMPGEYSGMFRYNNHGAGVCFCCGWPGGHTGASYWGDHAPKGQSLFPNTEYISFYVNGKEMRSNTITTTPGNVSCN